MIICVSNTRRHLAHCFTAIFLPCTADWALWPTIDIQEELRMIHTRIEEENKVAGGEGKGIKNYFVGCIREMKVPSIRHRFALVLGMMFLQNFSGAITISKLLLIPSS